MLKKRILASSLASVMALSSVSVVAFADETATAEYGEVVTRPELKEFLKTYDNLIKGDINNYGSVQALRFQEAYDHAAYVAADADADEASIIAAYQMVKAVYDTLQQYTNEQLKELVEECKPTYDRNNILNLEIYDNIYDTDAFADFQNAYIEAENTIGVDDLMMTTDAYIKLSEAYDTLLSKKLTPVSKDEYRALIREYEGMLAQFGKNETWRRGKVSVNPITGRKNKDDSKDNDLTKAVYVTWGELQTIVRGDSDLDVVKEVKPIVRNSPASDSDFSKATGEDTYISRLGLWVDNGGATVETTLYTQSEIFDGYMSAVKTTDTKIKAAYDAAKEAISVFKSWKAIDADSTAKGQANSTVSKYRNQLANNFEQTLIKSLVVASAQGITDKLSFNKKVSGVDTPTAALEYKDGKLLGVKGAAEAGCVLRIDSGTNLIQLDEVVGKPGYAGAHYDPADHGTTRKSYTIKIADGVDYMKYIPVRAGNVVISATDVDTDLIDVDTDLKVDAVQNALTMLEAYTAEANKGKNSTEATKAAVYGTATPAATFATYDDVADLDENTTVTKPALTSREYTLINRYLTYALEDLYPVVKDPCSHTRTEVKALIEKAYDLINETGSCSIFAELNDELAKARKDAVEWVRESEKDKLYKDNDPEADPLKNHGNFRLASAGTDVNATYVYHTLSCKGTTAPYNDTYDALADKLKEYPISYGEIVEKIAEVNEGVEAGEYGETVKTAVDKVAYCMSVLKASVVGNEAYTDERALNAYNRLRSNDKGNDSEKALEAALEALDKAIEEDDKEPEKPAATGDLDGDGKVLPGDAKAALELFLNEKYDAAADMDGNGVITPADARAILEIFLKG